jgi:hypothetical protein
MPALTAALSVVGVLCLLDLILTLGVIRRLREHTEMLAEVNGGPPPVMRIQVGSSPAHFSAIAADGGLVSGASGLFVVAFFSSSCPICPERVEPFARYLTNSDVPPDRALVVIVGPVSDPPPYRDRLAAVARLVAEDVDGEISRAYQVVAFPAFALMDGTGNVLAASHDPAELPVVTAAP